MTTITSAEYRAIVRAAITPTHHSGDFDGLVGFAEACYGQNSVADLLVALRERTADRNDCEAWGITATGWRAAITEALEALAYEFESEHGFAA